MISYRNGGYAVLVHPEVNLKDCEGIADPILEAGVDGIEDIQQLPPEEQAGFYHKAARQTRMTPEVIITERQSQAVSIGGHECSPGEEMVRQLGVYSW